MYMIIYKQAYVTSLTAKLAKMNLLLKFIFIITPIRSQKRYLDIGQNFHFKPFSQKILKFNFLEKSS